MINSTHKIFTSYEAFSQNSRSSWAPGLLGGKAKIKFIHLNTISFDQLLPLRSRDFRHLVFHDLIDSIVFVSNSILNSRRSFKFESCSAGCDGPQKFIQRDIRPCRIYSEGCKTMQKFIQGGVSHAEIYSWGCQVMQKFIQGVSGDAEIYSGGCQVMQKFIQRDIRPCRNLFKRV